MGAGRSGILRSEEIIVLKGHSGQRRVRLGRAKKKESAISERTSGEWWPQSCDEKNQRKCEEIAGFMVPRRSAGSPVGGRVGTDHWDGLQGVNNRT